MTNEKAKEQFLKIWNARRVLWFTGMITESQNRSIVNKITKFRKKYKFTCTEEELWPELSIDSEPSE